MANLVKKQSFGGPDKQILIAEDSYKVTLGAVIAATGAVDVNGKKILKAGTPVKGDLKARKTAFVKEATTPNAILLHDVDVTAGANNATILLAGCVDLLKLDASVVTLIDDAAKTALKNIIFVKGSAI